MRSFAILVLLAFSALLLAFITKAIQPPIATSEPMMPAATLADETFDQALYGMPGELTRIGGVLKRGETLSGLLNRMDLPADEAASAINSWIAAEHLDPRRIKAGFEVSAYMDEGRLTALSASPEPGVRLLTKRGADAEFRPVALRSQLVEQSITLTGAIETSLYVELRRLGARDQQVVDFAQVFAYDVDFQREIHPGDRFEVVYTALVDERGTPIRDGSVLYAALNGRVVDKAYYRFTAPDDGVSDYFQANGESATRFLMKTPINGARLSSSFGTRRHPISGYTRLHKGTDFAAPTGTPVYAAGHGTVERASRYGGYGHYVRIRHANGYKTAYAHLSRYGRGIKAGAKVRQGQIIGYVGSTGASTGPHLHYEVYIHGKPVNAMTLKLPTGRKLAQTPEIMALFEAERERIDAMRDVKERGGNAPQVAQAVPPAP